MIDQNQNELILEIRDNYQKIKINKLINNKKLKSIYYKDLQNDYRVVKIFNSKQCSNLT